MTFRKVILYFRFKLKLILDMYLMIVINFKNRVAVCCKQIILDNIYIEYYLSFMCTNDIFPILIQLD